MAKTFLILFTFLVGLASYKNNGHQTSVVCGPHIFATNQNSFDDNNLYKVKIKDVLTGVVYNYEPSLNFGDPDVLLYTGGGGYYDIEIVYYSDNSSNYGYVYLEGPFGIEHCQSAAFGTQTIKFNNIWFTCGYYKIGVKSTPC